MKQSIVRLFATETVKIKPKVSIPYAIKRSPTDLLQALNSTVGTDKTAPHFAFIDDPTTIPTTTQQKKNYFLAKELGKRAARQLAEEWPTLFAFDRDLPRLPAFRPEKALDPLEIEATTENLSHLIEGNEVASAVRLFERMQSENVEISSELQTKLFQLVAYYNAEDVPLMEIQEWPGLRNFYSSGESKWQEAGIPDLLFEGIEKNAINYSTMIAALCKYPTDVSVLRAKNLFKEMISKNLVPAEEAFSAIITVSNQKEMVEVLQKMNSLHVAPSVRTFNACLTVVSRLEKLTQQWKAITQILGEMKVIGIQPSLSTYSIVLETIAPSPREDNKQIPIEQLQLAVNVLNEILVRIEMGGNLESIDSNDQYFFLNAIRIAIESNNEELVDRIEKVYTDRKNTVAMTALTTESVFYSRFLLFKATKLPLEPLEKLYKELVPRVVGTTRQLTITLVERLRHENKWSFAKRIVGDSFSSRHLVDYAMSASIRKLLLAQDTFKMTSVEKEEYQNEVIRMVDAVLEFANFTKPYMKKLQLKITPQHACECALLLIKADKYKRAWELVEMLLNDENKKGDLATVTDQGFAPSHIMIGLLDAALEHKDWYNASNCIQLISYYQPHTNLEPLIAKMEVKCSLSPIQRRLLKNFVKLRQ
uniref:Small ribosomal subunit protein mS39 n=1 Tax=Panagrolaimus sp. ES5 TaxID=591445 RepID=A0AC34FEB4_9BILA